MYQHIAGLVLPDAVRRSWHPALRSLLKAHGALVRRVVGRVRRYHAAYAREIWLDEVRGLASLDETEAVVTSGRASRSRNARRRTTSR